jgi:hypothetical protein
MLDCHIIVSPDTPRAWVTQCLDSVHEAADRAGFPVAVHVVTASGPHIGHDRAAGYALGRHPYVTSVDDDDWIEPNAFAVLSDVLADNPVAVTTGCIAHQHGKSFRLPWRTNLRVFRRDVAASAPLIDWPVYDGPAMLAHADGLGEVIEINSPVYHYRLHVSGHRRLMRDIEASMRDRIAALPAGVHMARAA